MSIVCPRKAFIQNGLVGGSIPAPGEERDRRGIKISFSPTNNPSG